MSLIVSHETAGLKIDIFNLISRKTRIPESFGQYKCQNCLLRREVSLLVYFILAFFFQDFLTSLVAMTQNGNCLEDFFLHFFSL